MFDYSKAEIENLIRIFVAKTLDNEVPDHKCFTVCYILSVYLTIYNISHIIKSGTVTTLTDGIGHYIITITHENSEFDVDPTVQQIDKNSPQVLIKETLYTDSNFSKIEFDNAYENWEYPLVHGGSKKPWPEVILQKFTKQQLEIENQKIEIIPYLRILIKAYYIFKQEIFEMECKGKGAIQEFAILFFKKTENIVKQNKDKSGKFGSTLINNKFDEMLVI